MLILSMDLSLSDGAELLRLDLELHPGYGADPEVAHRALQLALVVAEWPIVVEATGAMLRLPPGALQQFNVRRAPS